MSSNDLLIVGLGNPGVKYENTRHNVGFLLLDELARRWGGAPETEKWRSLSCRISRWGRRLTLVKPQTYMNRSGQAVSEIAGFFKVLPENIIVIHDDLDMHPGRLKLVFGGGAGGHNGIRSITQSLGSNGFYRLKVGIGRPGQGEVHPDVPVENYVLSALTRDEKALLDERITYVEDGLRHFIEDGPSRAMSLINSIK